MSEIRVLSLSVSDPQTDGEGLSKKTTYLITSQLEYKDGNSMSSETYVYKQRRRFNEFKTFYNAFKAYCKEPFPEKNLLGRFNDEIVEQRRIVFNKILHELITTKPGVLCEKEFSEFLGLGHAVSKFTSSQKYFLGVSCNL